MCFYIYIETEKNPGNQRQIREELGGSKIGELIQDLFPNALHNRLIAIMPEARPREEVKAEVQSLPSVAAAEVLKGA